MSVAIDAAGRLVIPKGVREAAGITPGMPLAIRVRDGRIEIEPSYAPVEIVERDGIAVAVPTGPPSALSAEAVRATLESLRQERG